MANKKTAPFSSSLTDMVHTQSELNLAIKNARLNLSHQGVDVKRRELEEALSPVLVSGKTHAIASAHLKAKPNTAQGMVKKLIVDAENNQVAELVNSMASELNDIALFSNTFDRRSEYIAGLLKEIDLSEYPAIESNKEIAATFNAVRTAFETKVHPDICHIEIRNVGDLYEYRLFDIDIVVNKHSVKIKAEDIGLLMFDSIIINGINILGKESIDEQLANELIEWSGAFYRVLKASDIEKLSNRLTANVTPALIEMLVANSSVSKANKPTRKLRNPEVGDINNSLIIVDKKNGVIDFTDKPSKTINNAKLFSENEIDQIKESYGNSCFVTEFRATRVVSHQELKHMFWHWITEEASTIWEDTDGSYCDLFDFSYCGMFGRASDERYVLDDSKYSVFDIWEYENKLSRKEYLDFVDKETIGKDAADDRSFDAFQSWSKEKLLEESRKIDGVHVFEKDGVYLVALDTSIYIDEEFFDVEDFLCKE